MINALQVFSKVPPHILRPWLEQERDEAYRYLSNAGDLVGIHRAQGKVQLVEKMLDLMEKAAKQS